MRFGLYALAEFADVIMFACLASAIFLGGWHLPFVDVAALDVGIKIGEASLNPLVQTLVMIGIFLAKVSVLVFIVMWIRWTLPRLRVDQLMNLCWKYLIPISFANLFFAAIWMWAFDGQSLLQLMGRWLGVSI
jgi:NADH-quinone oxidoreductase subunit H